MSDGDDMGALRQEIQATVTRLEQEVADLQGHLDKKLTSLNAAKRALAALSSHDVRYSGRRAVGTVKPAILRVVRENPGMTNSEITNRTGFKNGSVRGTLWGLAQEGLVARDGDRWVPVCNTPDPEIATPLQHPQENAR